MARQDLVVKLLLDSGAFGNDIREAERKAKDFSDNMSKAGKTAGEFGKEIGLSAGALGKLGGVLAGGSAVIAAVGAFKSIMESTHGTAKQFHGTIAGFNGVLGEFKKSLATMDFSVFNAGLMEIWKNSKLAKEALMDFAKSEVAYGYISSDFKREYETYKTIYQSKNTSQEERDSIKEAVSILIDSYSKTTNEKVNDTLDKFILQLKAAAPDLNIDTDAAGRELAKKLLLDSSYIIASGGATQKEDEKKTKEFKKELNRLTLQKKGLQFSMSNAVGSEQIRAFQEAIDAIDAEIAKKYSDNIDLLFRSVIYAMKPEEYQQAVSLVQTSNQQNEALEKFKQDFNGWNAAAEETNGTLNNTTTEVKAIEGSVKRLKDDISEISNLRDNSIFGSDDWKKYTDQLKEYNEELERLLMLTSIYENGSKDPETAMKSVKMATPKGLKGEIEYPDKLSTPEGYIKAGVSLVPPEGFETVDQLIQRVEDLNVAWSSNINLIYAMGDALRSSENSSVRALAGITDAVGIVSSGIMEVLQIQQACAAATGVTNAAKMPYPYNLAAIATVMTTIISTFASIKQMAAGKYAEGGIVGGTSYSGDKLFAMVNSGEMILNKRQQKNLSNMLGGGGGQVEFYISGDNLVGVLNNRENKRHLTR